MSAVRHTKMQTAPANVVIAKLPHSVLSNTTDPHSVNTKQSSSPSHFFPLNSHNSMILYLIFILTIF